VTGDFVRTGAMDRANFALARHLANQGFKTHLVAHQVDRDLAESPNIIVHRVPRPAGSHLLGAPLLDRAGHFWAQRIRAQGGLVLSNGGSCVRADVNWVHYVHAAYRRRPTNTLRAVKAGIAHRRAIRLERVAIKNARVIIANSNRTRTDLIQLLGVPDSRVHTIYLGVEPRVFRPADPNERAEIRASLEWPKETPMIVFVGALGDRRKGFDTLFDAWRRLCRDRAWDAVLVVVGAGAEARIAARSVDRAKIGASTKFLGYRMDLSKLLRACDALVSPTRYDSYGLGVHEALCCGLPAIVSADAGVAERYPSDLRDLLLPDPEDVDALVRRLLAWRANSDCLRERVRSFSRQLRSYTWDDMARDIVALVESLVESTDRELAESSVKQTGVGPEW
jgi:glycosyltransferase involved in cell wall biosynthesis